MYAIVDIETTGGKYNEEGITEIAIYKFDGHEIVDQFISLVNPEREIQPFVVNLTGINNKMLRDAPKFYEIAKRVVEITEDCIIVAHNASFDYRILQTEFKRLGFEYKRKSLCTVELSQKLLPEMESYKLGKLVRALGIPMSDRHRASGDALATVKLFQLLLDRDSEKNIIQQAVKSEIKKKVATRLLDMLETLPSETGVYYIHNAKGDIIYIGKSRNIKKRVNQHFTGTNNKSKKIQKQVAAVTFERTGSELVALLKESEEIKRKKPMYNRAQRGNIFQFAMTSYVDDYGYIGFRICKADARKKYITTFTNMSQAKHVMFKLTEEFQLCQKINELHSTKNNCFQYTINECHGACIQKEAPESYNERAQQAIDKYSYTNKNMLIIDRGRHHDERSAILIENGEYKGFGFYSLNYQITNKSVLKTIITPMQNNRDVQHIIQSFLRRKNRLKIITL
ncbi:DNA polymerase-3 subunit epsilon [Kordia periserrulae]|uniref:DNA polymerase-3 subunit epsilon n=1 Tax=Kordia periserrulae TaxID=701523 RepID=A0A2T6BUG0_9FLAO|nr:exonuclease domain-containing protein [Kordia periserrulae]PTX59715.1 DNA polymerase-3 subunit epsilon [Kordia periserrulae]